MTVLTGPAPSGPRNVAPVAILALVLTGLLLACSTAMTPERTRIPLPDDAQVEVGGAGGGYDAGARLYAFVSSRTPDAALAAYASDLEAAGYEPAGRNGAWSMFTGHGRTIAVNTGQTGPPTDLLVRVTDDGQAADGKGSPAGSSTTHPGSSPAGPTDRPASGGPSNTTPAGGPSQATPHAQPTPADPTPPPQPTHPPEPTHPPQPAHPPEPTHPTHPTHPPEPPPPHGSADESP
ncbi:MAG TPA: hypothetical protein VFW86_06810 [Candidatus Limnocylindrales bacterium]|nr:hypothetical protein [Candidatus Limnocylindrales bacterium]